MSKVKLNIKLNSDEENLDLELIGIRNNNKIVYKENNITVTILIYNNKIEMSRVCDDYKINLIFENKLKTVSTYSVFGAPKIFELETITNELIIDDDKIKIVYELEGNKFDFSLNQGGKNGI